MGYRDDEKAFYEANSVAIFGEQAGVMGGDYRNIPRDFCLPNDLSAHNLHNSIRSHAIQYFLDRSIPWHDGFPIETSGGIINSGRPSNHTCCSQSQCVNVFFPFREEPAALLKLVRGLGFDASEMLHIKNDGNDNSAFVGFEWIGAHNYLLERNSSMKRTARCFERTRGANYTSVDFVLRFRNSDERTVLILGEWKYTEKYKSAANYTPAELDTRVRIYTEWYKSLKHPRNVKFEDLLFEPFYQLMRQQMLASQMEVSKHKYGVGEMGADEVVVLHVSPTDNHELRDSITSERLQILGNDIYTVWGKFAPGSRFFHSNSEDVIEKVSRVLEKTQFSETGTWLMNRYAR